MDRQTGSTLVSHLQRHKTNSKYVETHMRIFVIEIGSYSKEAKNSTVRLPSAEESGDPVA